MSKRTTGAATASDQGGTAPAGFKPTPHQRVFAVRYLEAVLDANGPIRDRDVAVQARVTPQTVSEWRNHVRGFDDWLSSEIRSAVAARWTAVLGVAWRFAMRGSIEHMKFLASILEPVRDGGQLGAGAMPGDGRAGPETSIYAGAVIVNIPQPPEELVGHVVVRGLLEMAQPIDGMPAQAQEAP